MNIQLDTLNKIIKLEGGINLHQFINILNILLPNDDWKMFSLHCTPLIDWRNPIIIDPTSRYLPPWYVYTVSLNSNTTTELSPGLFNILLINKEY